MPEILLTNDDGVWAPGLHSLIEPLKEIGNLHIIAPDRNRSAISRAITIHHPLQVQEVELPDGTPATALDGTPVDCVRLAALGICGVEIDAVVSGVNHGVNLGDDVTYSGTVGAALEGLMCGWSAAVAVSCQPRWVPPSGRYEDAEFDFAPVAEFAGDFLAAALRREVPAGCAYNINSPAHLSHTPPRAAATRLGRRIYNDQLLPHPAGKEGIRYSLYNAEPSHHTEDGTDFAAHVAGEISVSPIDLRITHVGAIGGLAQGIEHINEARV